MKARKAFKETSVKAWMKMKKLLLEARKKEKKNCPLLYSGRKFGNPMAAFTQKIKNMLNKLADLAKDIS